MRSNQAITMSVLPNDVLQFDVKGAGVVVFDLNKVHEANRGAAEIHGWKQRVVDAAAMSRDTATGASASPDAKKAAIEKVVRHYESGTERWTLVAEGGPKGGLLFEALVRLYGHAQAPSEIRTFLDGLSDKEAAALREDAEVLPVIEKIKAEKRAATPEAERVDTASILSKLKTTKHE